MSHMVTLWIPGGGELMIILLLALLVFGARRLPEIGKALGESVRMFKKGLSGEEDLNSPDTKEEQKERLENGEHKEER